jgi:hypothetical protein
MNHGVGSLAIQKVGISKFNVSKLEFERYTKKKAILLQGVLGK